MRGYIPKRTYSIFTELSCTYLNVKIYHGSNNIVNYKCIYTNILQCLSEKLIVNKLFFFKLQIFLIIFL